MSPCPIACRVLRNHKEIQSNNFSSGTFHSDEVVDCSSLLSKECSLWPTDINWPSLVMSWLWHLCQLCSWAVLSAGGVPWDSTESCPSGAKRSVEFTSCWSGAVQVPRFQRCRIEALSFWEADHVPRQGLLLSVQKEKWEKVGKAPADQNSLSNSGPSSGCGPNVFFWGEGQGNFGSFLGGCHDVEFIQDFSRADCCNVKHPQIWAWGRQVRW